MEKLQSDINWFHFKMFQSVTTATDRLIGKNICVACTGLLQDDHNCKCINQV